jgi:hypothetical protein
MAFQGKKPVGSNANETDNKIVKYKNIYWIIKQRSKNKSTKEIQLQLQEVLLILLHDSELWSLKRRKRKIKRRN